VTGKRRTGYLLYKDTYRSTTGMSKSTNIILPNYDIFLTTGKRNIMEIYEIRYSIGPVSVLFLFPVVKDLEE
jgi:hypothetical protein